MNTVLEQSFSSLKKNKIEAVIKTKYSLHKWLTMPIGTFLDIFEEKNVNVRLWNALSHRGVEEVGDIFFYTKDALKNNEGISDKRLRQMGRRAYFGFDRAYAVEKRRQQNIRILRPVNGKALKHLEEILAVLGLALDD